MQYYIIIIMKSDKYGRTIISALLFNIAFTEDAVSDNEGVWFSLGVVSTVIAMLIQLDKSKL